MHFYFHTFFILIFTILNSKIARADRHHPCSDKFHELVKGRNLSHCQRLPTLGAELGWSNYPTKETEEVGIKVVFGAPFDDEMGWLAWGVNPGPDAEMVGTRAAIGIKDPAKGLSCRTYNVTAETRIGCRLHHSNLEEIKCLDFEYNSATQYHLITANVNMSNVRNVSKLNMVWQIGLDVEGDEPKNHVATLKNVDSVETLDLISEKSSDMAHIKVNLRKVHGIMNIVGWGTLLPIGVIVARYFREFPFRHDESWFYFHVVCQSVGYLIGVIGWGIGMWLAHNSPRYTFFTHRLFAISIFVCATLQTLALWFRPSPQDDFRKVWNIYHHFLGYTLLILVYINIFEGIKIMKPENKDDWKFAVVGILIALGSITLLLECYTWFKFYDEKSKLRNKHEADSSSVPIKGDGEDPRRVTSSPIVIGGGDSRRETAGPIMIGGGDPRGGTAGRIMTGGGDPRGKTFGPIMTGEGDPREVTGGPIMTSGGDPRGPIMTGGGNPRGETVGPIMTGGEDPREETTGSIMTGGGDPHGMTGGPIMTGGNPRGMTGGPIKWGRRST